MNQSTRNDGYRISDTFREQKEPLLPTPTPHPLGCHRPRIPNCTTMDAILLVLRLMAPEFALGRRRTDGLRTCPFRNVCGRRWDGVNILKL